MRLTLIATLLVAIIVAPAIADEATIPLQHRSAAGIANIFTQPDGITPPGELRIEPLLPQNAIRAEGTADEIAEFREMLDLVDAEERRARITVRLLATDQPDVILPLLKDGGVDNARTVLGGVSADLMQSLLADGTLRVVEEAAVETVSGSEASVTVAESQCWLVPQVNPDDSIKVLLRIGSGDEIAHEIMVRVPSGHTVAVAAMGEHGELAGPIYAVSAKALRGDRAQAAAPARIPTADVAWVKVRRVSAEDTDMLAEALFGRRAGGHPEVRRRSAWWEEAALSLTLERLVDDGQITVAYAPSVKVEPDGAGKVFFFGEDGAVSGCYWFEGRLEGETISLEATVITPEDHSAGLEPLIFSVDLVPGRTFVLADVDAQGHLQRPVYLVSAELAGE